MVVAPSTTLAPLVDARLRNLNGHPESVLQLAHGDPSGRRLLCLLQSITAASSQSFIGPDCALVSFARAQAGLAVARAPSARAWWQTLASST